MKDASFFEKQLHLNIVFRQRPSGVTEDSKELFNVVRNKIGKPEIVYLIYVGEPSWNFFTYVSDSERKTLCFDGFAWGYHGEGPRGLKWLFEQIGFWPNFMHTLNAHKPGCWGVQPDGLITSPPEWLH